MILKTSLSVETLKDDSYSFLSLSSTFYYSPATIGEDDMSLRFICRTDAIDTRWMTPKHMYFGCPKTQIIHCSDSHCRSYGRQATCPGAVCLVRRPSRRPSCAGKGREAPGVCVNAPPPCMAVGRLDTRARRLPPRHEPTVCHCRSFIARSYSRQLFPLWQSTRQTLPKGYNRLKCLAAHTDAFYCSWTPPGLRRLHTDTNTHAHSFVISSHSLFFIFYIHYLSLFFSLSLL